MLRIPGGDGNPLYKLYRYVLPNQVGFLLSFGLKTGIHCLCSEIGFEEFLCLRYNLSNDNVISAKGQALVVQRLDSTIQQINLYPVDNTIQQINLYPVDSAISSPITYLLDSDLSSG